MRINPTIVTQELDGCWASATLYIAALSDVYVFIYIYSPRKESHKDITENRPRTSFEAYQTFEAKFIADPPEGDPGPGGPGSSSSGLAGAASASAAASAAAARLALAWAARALRVRSVRDTRGI